MQKENKIVYIFIDASNVWNVARSEKKMLDFDKLKQYFKTFFKTENIKIFYYDAYPKEGTREYSIDGKHKFFTFLKKGLGFVVRKKELKRISVVCDGASAVLEKGNMDVEITIDAVHNKDKFDVAVLLSGDADFIALLRYLKNDGKQAFVYSSQGSISHEMKTGGDGYTDLREIKEIWGSDLKHREVSKNKTTLN